MAGLLISGPAGAGKSQQAREELSARPGTAVAVDFQSVYAALLLLERLPDGRYPERSARDEYIIPLVEYTRRAIITGALGRELFVIATNSDGNPIRRNELLTILGDGATEVVIDPGEAVVRARLAGPSGEPSPQCQQAIARWYGRRDG